MYSSPEECKNATQHPAGPVMPYKTEKPDVEMVDVTDAMKVLIVDYNDSVRNKAVHSFQENCPIEFLQTGFTQKAFQPSDKLYGVGGLHTSMLVPMFCLLLWVSEGHFRFPSSIKFADSFCFTL